MKKDVRIKEEGFEGGWDGWLMSWWELTPLGYTYMIWIQETEWKKGRVRQQSLFKYKLIQLLLPRQEELEMSWGIYVYVPAWVFFWLRAHICVWWAGFGRTYTGHRKQGLGLRVSGSGERSLRNSCEEKEKKWISTPKSLLPITVKVQGWWPKGNHYFPGTPGCLSPFWFWEAKPVSSSYTWSFPLSKGKDLFLLSGFMTFQSPSMLCSKCKSF